MSAGTPPAARTAAPRGTPLAGLGRDEQLFLLLAIFTGVFSALGVVCFRIAIEWGRTAFLGASLRPSWPAVLLAPTLGGLAVGLLVERVFPLARSSGVNLTKAALYVYEGRVPAASVFGKFLTAALAIGSGHSLGPEDPSLHIGAGLSSIVGRGLRLSRERLRLVPSLGAAAGLAAAFNSPVTAVLFVIEEVVGRWSAGVLGAVILAAVSGVSVAHWFLGSEPLFRVPVVETVSPAELLAYAALGLVGGLAAVVFLKTVLFARPRLRALPRWTRCLQPAVAGALVGVIGLGWPEVMGAGYGTVDQVLHGDQAWQLLALLAALKILATALSFSSGTPGGLFAPTLVMGALVGGAVGRWQADLLPGLTGPVGVYVLVGMGTLFAGNLRAPMTSVFMILEITGNYSIVLPVMISNTIAYLVSRAFQRQPVFDALARQDGIELPSLEEQRETDLLRVEDAMRPLRGRVLQGDETLAAALAHLREAGESYALVRYEFGAWAGVAKAQIEERVAAGQGEEALESILPDTQIPHVYPDHLLDTALRYTRHSPLLPVVHRADFRKLLGVVSVADIVGSYRRAGGEKA